MNLPPSSSRQSRPAPSTSPAAARQTVATSSLSNHHPPLLSSSPSTDWALGSTLHITTTAGHTHTGALLIHDPTSHNIVLSAPSPRAQNGTSVPDAPALLDFHIIRISSIQSIRILSPAKPDSPFRPYESKPLALHDIKAREEFALKRAQDEEKRLGVGVSPEAQLIFDVFARTLPVSWVGQSIMVADSTLINPPYTVDAVVSVASALNGKLEDSANTNVSRIKHVLQAERVKLGLNSASGKLASSSASGVVERKGG